MHMERAGKGERSVTLRSQHAGAHRDAAAHGRAAQNQIDLPIATQALSGSSAASRSSCSITEA